MTRTSIPAAVDRRVREAARHRCGYCLSAQAFVMARLEIEHIVPLSLGGTDAEENLWLACPICNGHKANKVSALDTYTGELTPLYNPRTQLWHEHFEWSEDGLRIIGRTPTGRVTVTALRLDTDPDALTVRSNWIVAGWHPPKE